MSRAHINSKLQTANQLVTTDNATILLDRCMSTDFISTRGLYALLDNNAIYPSRGAPNKISPLGVKMHAGIPQSPTGSSYEFNFLGIPTKDGGLAYSLLTTPKTIFCRFKMLDSDKTRKRSIVMLYDVTSAYAKVYTEITTGDIKIEVRNGTTLDVYYATVSSVNVFDSNWHTIGIIINPLYAKVIVDGATISQTINYPSTFLLPAIICLGFDSDGGSGNIAMSDIRCDSTEYLDEDILGWTIYNKQFYDPYDYNSYVY